MKVNTEGLARTIVVVGASAGGVDALLKLIPALPAEFPAAVAIVLHRSPEFRSEFATMLARRSQLPVTEAQDRERILPGHVYLAPANWHLCMENPVFRLFRTPKVHWTRPAVDPLFRSAARAFGPRVVGVLLSGKGADGSSGLIAIKGAGGLSIVQHPCEAEHPDMANHAIVFDHVDAILPVDRIGATLVALAHGVAVGVDREVD